MIMSFPVRTIKTQFITYRRVVWKAFMGVIFTAALLFGTAGTCRWWNGWAFMAVFTAATALATAVFRRSPDLLEERRTAAKKAKAWDKALVPVLAVFLPFISLVLAALDRRFDWTRSVSEAASLIALVVAIGGVALTFWAMAANRFFSSHVRIQDDRGHVVVSGGPYARIRHPGYAGAGLYCLAAPVLLGSLVAFWVGLATVPLWILRTVLEDRTLNEELSGYREYAAKVRYRLVPSLW
jgi:protein-S-isoprenylcysteine O-methyltransferase Ste14